MPWSELRMRLRQAHKDNEVVVAQLGTLEAYCADHNVNLPERQIQQRVLATANDSATSTEDAGEASVEGEGDSGKLSI